MRKNCPSVNKNFFQVTEVEKGHQGKVFEAEAEGQGLEMFPRCPFSTKVTWKKNLFTRGLFFPNKFVRTIMTTDCFFAHLPTFRMNISNLAINLKVLKEYVLEKKIRQKKNPRKMKKNFGKNGTIFFFCTLGYISVGQMSC